MQKRGRDEPQQRTREDLEQPAQHDDPIARPRSPHNLRPGPRRAQARTQTPEAAPDPAPQQEQDCGRRRPGLHVENDEHGYPKTMHICAPPNAYECSIRKSHKTVYNAESNN
jgi:hypothetical protein